MKRVLLWLIWITPCIIQAQTITQIKNDSKNYIFGEGQATTIRQADSYALAEIISQISVTVESDMTYDEQTITTNDKTVFEGNFESVIKTYSNATLTNTNQIIIENEPDAHVFRYIKRSDIDRIFEARKFKVETMLEEAHEALSETRINDALRYYYWSHALLKSLRYPNEVFIYDDDGKKQIVNVWIPTQINKILRNLRITIKKIHDNQIYFNILYNNKKVNSIDFSIFDGRGWGNIYSSQDGIGVAEINGNEIPKYIQFKTEYAFVNESVVDPEVYEILKLVTEVSYKNAYVRISSDELIVKEAEDIATEAIMAAESINLAQNENDPQNLYPNLTKLEDTTPFQTIIDNVLIGIIAKDTDLIKEYFTQNGLNSYQKLIEYGTARVIDSSSPQYYALGENTYCRNILMRFSFTNNKRVFTESVVFEFDKDKKISNVTFGLSRQAVEEVFAKESWPEAARIILIHFLEGYKSAYSLKQIDYIESVFADDALIITGSYVRHATIGEMSAINGKYTKLTKQSKSEYIRKLKYVFMANEYININFADTDLIKAGKGGEIYGIQLKQEYHSTNYGDTGYLFLMVDLNDIEKPIIHVRTWQPEKDPNFGTYGLSDF